MQTSIQVKYKSVDAWHVFSSDDLPGLYVAHTDAERAFKDVALAIKKLVKLDEGIDCEVSAEMTFEEFLRDQKGKPRLMPAPVSLSQKRFVLRAA